MKPVLKDLIEQLSLERLEDNLFRGSSRDIGTTRVYGGQVLGQAIRAAQYTVGDLHVHSLHAYFLRSGDHNAPIIYEVDRSRDGNSFSSRRVVAIQHGRPIFTLSASFQVAESGLEYQIKMPEVTKPDSLEDIASYVSNLGDQIPKKLNFLIILSESFELRSVESIDLEHPQKREPYRHMWIRTREKLPDDPTLHQSILAYISDFSLLDTNLLPHGLHVSDKSLQIASLDHAMWFHRDFRIDEWLLYSCEGISASEARGLSKGNFYTHDGILVASTVQEGLIRIRD